jgi:hypothetical protein
MYNLIIRISDFLGVFKKFNILALKLKNNILLYFQLKNILILYYQTHISLLKETLNN